MIPIYNCEIKDNWCDGIFCISLVDEPAVESNFIAFSKDEKAQYMKFSTIDEKEHKILGVMLRADFPIYRYDAQMGEYYLKFTKENIEKLAQKMMNDHTFNSISLQHDGNIVNEIQLQQIFIKNSDKGISPIGFEDIEEGSLFGQFKVNNIEVWEKIQSGEIKGFSVEGYFSLSEVQMNKQNKKDKNTMAKLREALRKLLAEFGSVETDKGAIEWEGDKQLEVGDEVFQGENPAQDGEYKVDDKVFVVVDGKVAEIKDLGDEEDKIADEPKPIEEPKKEEEMGCGSKKTNMEEEQAPTEEEKPIEEAPIEEEYDAKGEIEALKVEIKELKKIIDEIINKPVDEPVAEQFRKVTEIENTGDSKLDKAIKRFSYLK